MLKQHRFLNDLLFKLDSDAQAVITKISDIRKLITDPSNLNLYLATNLDLIKTPTTAFQEFLPASQSTIQRRYLLLQIMNLSFNKSFQFKCLSGLQIN